ncbi:M20 family metallopeptidase [Candidatus Micrarchaeota archaeon]|nr:M20 family metallopeptidase [Candidatus Micrarchaeota archaeon]
MDDIGSFFDGNRNRIVQLCQELVRVDTVNPPGNEWRAAEILEREFRRLNIPYERLEKEKGRTNLLGRIGKGKPELLIAAHFDTVPFGDGWTREPLGGTEENGRVYGRGSMDDKGQLAPLILAAEYLKKHESELNGTVVIGGVADEERGSHAGSKWLTDSKGVHPDYCLVPECSDSMGMIVIAEKGVLWFRVVINGVQAHGSTPDKGVNAILLMNEFLAKFRKLKFPARHETLKKTTINYGIIKGGAATNIVAGRCELEIDVRYVPPYTDKTFLDAAGNVLEEVVTKQQGASFAVETINHEPAFFIEPKHPFVQKVRSIARKTLGHNVRLQGVGGGTISKDFVRHGAVSITFGPGKEEVLHKSDEYIDIPELVVFGKIVTRVCLETLK